MKKHSILIFDVDGVLGNFHSLRIERDKAHIAAVAKKMSLPFKDVKEIYAAKRAELRKQGRYSTINVMSAFGFSETDYYSIMNSVPVEGKIKISANAIRTLSVLSDYFYIAALTNTPEKSTIETLSYLKLLSFFDRLYCIDNSQSVKPSTEIFTKILNDFSVTEGWSIGDSYEKDLLPAKKAGLKTIFYAAYVEGGNPDVDHEIDDLFDLIDILGMSINDKE